MTDRIIEGLIGLALAGMLVLAFVASGRYFAAVEARFERLDAEAAARPLPVEHPLCAALRVRGIDSPDC